MKRSGRDGTSTFLPATRINIKMCPLHLTVTWYRKKPCWRVQATLQDIQNKEKSSRFVLGVPARSLLSIKALLCTDNFNTRSNLHVKHFGFHKRNTKHQKYLPVQLCWSSEIPGLQKQMYDPLVLLHRAVASLQLWIFSAHSSISEKKYK